MGRKFVLAIFVILGFAFAFCPMAFAEDPILVDVGEALGVNDMAVVGTTIYVANRDGLIIFDVTNPSVRQTIAIEGGAKKVLVAGNYAYLTNGDDQLVVVKLGENETPPVDGVSNRPRFDSQHMELTIPEVEVNGRLYTVIMKQRGASSNFEVTFAAPVHPDEAQDE